MGQMWADVQGNLVANYSSAGAGATYTAWAAELKSAQGGAWIQDPTVDFAALATNNCNPALDHRPAAWSTSRSSGNRPTAAQHNYATCGLIGQNLS